MKKTVKYMLFAAAIFVGTTAFAGAPPHRPEKKHNDGLRLAAGIVNLAAQVFTPAPQHCCQTPPPPRKEFRRKEHHRPAPPPKPARKPAPKPGHRR